MNHPHQTHDAPPFLRWVFWGFAAIAAFFLITEHGAHLLGVLPFLLILACPLMHIFGHHGHGHGADPKEPTDQPRAPNDQPAGDNGSSTGAGHHHH